MIKGFKSNSEFHSLRYRPKDIAILQYTHTNHASPLKGLELPPRIQQLKQQRTQLYYQSKYLAKHTHDTPTDNEQPQSKHKQKHQDTNQQIKNTLYQDSISESAIRKLRTQLPKYKRSEVNAFQQNSRLQNCLSDRRFQRRQASRSRYLQRSQSKRQLNMQLRFGGNRQQRKAQRREQINESYKKYKNIQREQQKYKGNEVDLNQNNECKYRWKYGQGIKNYSRVIQREKLDNCRYLNNNAKQANTDRIQWISDKNDDNYDYKSKYRRQQERKRFNYQEKFNRKYDLQEKPSWLRKQGKEFEGKSSKYNYPFKKYLSYSKISKI